MIGAVVSWGRDHPRTVLVVILLLSQLPFLDQAVHIDDRLYLLMAEQALETPLFPQAVATSFEGIPVADLAGHSHLPLVSWYLAGVRALTGSTAEAVFHMAMLIFPIAAVLAFYDLGKRWTGRGPTAALLLAFSPAFAVLSHTLMTDVPQLALWLVALSRWQALLDGDGRRFDGVCVVAAVCGAALISLLAGGLVLLLAAAWWLAKDRQTARRQQGVLVAAAAAPLVLWVLWYGRAWIYYERFVLLGTLDHMRERATLDPGLLIEKAFSFLLNTGGVFLFPVMLFIVFGGPVVRRAALLGGALSLIPIFAADAQASWSLWPAAAVAVFSAAGVLIVIEAGRALRDGAPHERLAALWILGIAAAGLLLYSAGSVRYVLPALPPVIILWIGQVGRRYQSLGRPFFLALGAGATLAWGWPVAAGDYQFAQTYREASPRLVADYGGPGRIWFTAEWGLRYYLEQEGAELLARDSVAAEAGDIVIKPRLASPWVTRYDAGHLELVEQREATRDPPVRILDFTSHAGFYSTAWGILPFSVGDESWEWFNVYRVTGRPAAVEP